MVDPLIRFEIIVVLIINFKTEFLHLRLNYFNNLFIFGGLVEERTVIFEPEDASL